IKALIEKELFGEVVTLMGWVRTRRSNKSVSFIALNDGSTIHNYQIVADPAVISEELLKKANTGACLKVTGKVVSSQGSGQTSELQAEQLEILGAVDVDRFPRPRNKHTLGFLRGQAHHRLRTTTFGAVFRVRQALAFAIHQYFNDNC